MKDEVTQEVINAVGGVLIGTEPLGHKFSKRVIERIARAAITAWNTRTDRARIAELEAEVAELRAVAKRTQNLCSLAYQWRSTVCLWGCGKVDHETYSALNSFFDKASEIGEEARQALAGKTGGE